MNFVATIFDSLFPPSFRRYWSFRNATALVVVLAVANALFRALVRLPPEQVAHLEFYHLLREPVFLVSYYVFVAIALWLVYVTRSRVAWYQCRVLVFTLVLTGAVIGLVDLLLPLRTS